MGVYIRVTKIEQLCCPKCGSKRIVGLQQEYCHCGQCGVPLQIHMPQDEWQRADMLWKSPVMKEDVGAAEKKISDETLRQNAETNIDKEMGANTEIDTEAEINADTDIDTETEEMAEFDLEDAGMIFRPDLEEAEWEFEPVYEQLSFFPFPE